jgi:hypothetical protein
VSAGSTHVIIDLPYGPHAKLKDGLEARTLGELFEYVAAGLGLHVKAMVTDGSSPIGRGIGPALEVRDVKRAGITRKAGAPTDLGAGEDLLATVGQYVEPGDGLFHIKLVAAQCAEEITE